MAVNAHDADQSILDAKAQVSEWMQEFDRLWRAPYTRAVITEFQQQGRRSMHEMLARVYDDKTRAELVNRIGEDKVKMFEQFIGWEGGNGEIQTTG